MRTCNGTALANDKLPPSRMVSRIGVNLGDVIVENDDLMATACNIAARLQAVEPGEICIPQTSTTVRRKSCSEAPARAEAQ